MARSDRIALLLCFCAMLAYAAVAIQIFENVPHLEDEYTLVWQAQAAARGQVLIPSPPSPDSFLVPFVIDAGGYRFGKYPLGFPVLLSLGIRLGLRDWVNPCIAACSLWLIYRLARRLQGEWTGLAALLLTATSPFFIINSANLLSHAWALFLSLGFLLAWLELFSFHSRIPGWLSCAVAGAALGALALTRPWTAVGIALPFGLHGCWLLWKGSPITRRRVIAVGLLAGGIASIHLLWQYVLTGSLWTNPYTLWWPFDTIGFGPGTGIRAGGHTWQAGLTDASRALIIGLHDVFGWPWLSGLFIPFGLWSLRRSPAAGLLAGVFLSLVLVYMLYWVGAWIFGPRYYFEGVYGWTILTAAGMSWILNKVKGLGRQWMPVSQGNATALARTPRISWNSLLALVPICLTVIPIALLISGNLIFYLPGRLGELKGLYGVSRAPLEAFQTPQAIARTPALVIVHAQGVWRRYGDFLELETPFLDTPFIFAISLNKITDQTLASDFPDRQVFHYYPEKPGQFFLQPLDTTSD